jgi:hypothetical protein
MRAASWGIVPAGMRKELASGPALAVVVSGLFAAAALSAPTPVKPPSISGRAAFGSVLTCNRGSWSPDAVSYSYAWTYGGGGPVFGTRAQWRADAARLDYAVVCQVTARDAHGVSTVAISPQVVIQQGISNVSHLRISGSHATVTVSGVAGPSGALAASKYGKPYIVLDRRLNKTTLLQLTNPKVLTKRNGHFTISAKDSPGRHTYVLLFVPATSSEYAETSVSTGFTLHR